MKYFLHVDYKEGATGWFCGRRNFIYLEKIAIVCEDGKEFEAVNHRELVYEIEDFLLNGFGIGKTYPTFYGYESAHQWVAFCQLFGKAGAVKYFQIPPVCIDLRQDLDRVNAAFTNDFSLWEDSEMPFQKDELEGMSAIEKARKYKELYEFLKLKQ